MANKDVKETLREYQAPHYKFHKTAFKYFCSVPNCLQLLFAELLDVAPPAHSPNQYISMNAEYRAQLCRTLNIADRTLRRRISELVQAGLLLHGEKNAYSINPYVVGLGYWPSVKKNIDKYGEKLFDPRGQTYQKPQKKRRGNKNKLQILHDKTA